MWSWQTLVFAKSPSMMEQSLTPSVAPSSTCMAHVYQTWVGYMLVSSLSHSIDSLLPQGPRDPNEERTQPGRGLVESGSSHVWHADRSSKLAWKSPPVFCCVELTSNPAAEPLFLHLLASIHRWKQKEDYWQNPKMQTQPSTLPHTRSQGPPEKGDSFTSALLLSF